MNSPIRQLREALQPFTDNSPGGKYRTRPEDFDNAKAAYESTASADDGVDWRQRAVDAEQMLRAVLKDYDQRVGTVPAQSIHKQLVRFVNSLDAEQPIAEGSKAAESSSCSSECPSGLPEEVPSTDELVRRCWRAAGGRFHGPNVETGTMPEARLLPYLHGLYQQIFDLRERQAASEADAEAAARWRALIGCARVRVLGSAGIYHRNANGSMHIGVEFWTHHETPSDPSAIEDLINFATLAAMDSTKSAEQV